jgi:alpha-1,2-mannosyltransferase
MAANEPLNRKQKFLQTGSLSILEQAGISILLLIALTYGVFVECRATLTKNHNTDLGVYLAAAQAVRHDGNLYSATYNFDHYMYPPLLAMLLARVTPAPVGYGVPATAAFAATVSLWYILSLLALALAISVLARTLAPPAPDAATPASLSWRPIWTLRLLPIMICLHCLGRELQLGQVDIFVLALMALVISCAAAGRSGQAGFWLALAICLKVMPVVLLVYPLWRRDWRWLLTCAGGLVVGLTIVPMLLFGPARTLKYSQEYTQALVLPALTGKVTDHSRDIELLDQNATHNYSIVGVIHNLEYITVARDDRPKVASARNRHLAAFMGLMLLLVTLLASGFRRQVSRTSTVLCLSMLMVVMLLISPVCQSYYFVLLIPVFMAVIAVDLRQSGAALPGPGILGVCAAYPVAQAISSLSPLLRDSGLVLATVLALWLVALKALNQSRQTEATADILPEVRNPLAA